jgi:hypothetical protein
MKTNRCQLTLKWIMMLSTSFLVILSEVESTSSRTQRYLLQNDTNIAGHSSCPCLTADQVAPATTDSVDAGNLTETYGIGCGYHDIATPACPRGADTCADDQYLVDCEDSWCQLAWCYVGKAETEQVFMVLFPGSLFPIVLTLTDILKTGATVLCKRRDQSTFPKPTDIIVMPLVIGQMSINTTLLPSKELR